MAKFLQIGTVNKKKDKPGFNITLNPTKDKEGKYDYDALIELHNALGDYLDNQAVNDAGYAENLFLNVQSIEEKFKGLVQNTDMTEERAETIKAKIPNFIKYEIQLIVED